nr:MAG TPA: hypothetical protein [Caudoviricetes sp.]
MRHKHYNTQKIKVKTNFAFLQFFNLKQSLLFAYVQIMMYYMCERKCL